MPKRPASVSEEGSSDAAPDIDAASPKRAKGEKKKVAIITGITGQDGSYLLDFLIEKGYTVHGIIRRASTFNTSRIEHQFSNRMTHTQKNMVLHYGDLSDSTCLMNLIIKVKPDEIYNLAAMSHVKVSFEMAQYTGNIDGLGTLRLLDAIRVAGLEKTCKFYQASTSELYGKVQQIPQSETTPFYPRSPYGVAKLYAFWICKNYRESYGMFISNGILFNHESPRRGETFVTRKITRAVAKIHLGLLQYVKLGNLDAKRDWGHARDYVEGMWKILQHDKPEDFVLSTGEMHSVREFVEAAFKKINVDVVWEGKGDAEIGKNKQTGDMIVKVDPQYYRPAEVELLVGDPTRAEEKLGWKASTPFQDLVSEMVESDIELMKKNPMA